MNPYYPGYGPYSQWAQNRMLYHGLSYGAYGSFDSFLQRRIETAVFIDRERAERDEQDRRAKERTAKIRERIARDKSRLNMLCIATYPDILIGVFDDFDRASIPARRPEDV